MGRHDLTFTNGASIIVTDKKFGNSCWPFTGAASQTSVQVTGNMSDFNFGSADFTVEFWFKAPSNSQYWPTLISGNPEGGWRVWIKNGTSHMMFSSSGNSDLESSADYVFNAWNHLAVVRNSSAIKMYLNGAQVASDTAASTYDGGFTTLIIGRPWTTAQHSFLGFLDEIRISKGVARWTAAFTPPTQPYVADAYTVLLCHCEADMLGTGAHTVVAPRNGVIFSTDTPNSNYSGSLKTGSPTGFLKLAASSDWEFGLGDFTIDCWLRQTTADDNYNGIISTYPTQGTGVNPYGWTLRTGPSDAIVMTRTIFNAPILTASEGLAFNTWTHVAVVRYGDTLSVYYNGVNKGSASVTGLTFNSNLGSNIVDLVIGKLYGDGDAINDDYEFKGNIAGLRISKGLARWTANFTPPNAPYSKPIGGVDGYTKLMLHFDKGNNSPIFEDSSLAPKNITVNGAIQKSDQMMFGRSCGYFNGSSSTLSLADSDDFNFGTGDFTIEGWIRIATAVNSEILCSAPVGQLAIGPSANPGYLRWDIDQLGGAAGVTRSDSTIPVGAWCHFALVRSSGVVAFYRDGVMLGTTWSNTNNVDLNGIMLGAHYPGSTFFGGHIDELRISKGIARYTTNFTPPTKPYDTPAIDGYTKLLLPLNGPNGSKVVLDSSPTGAVLAAGSSMQISTTTSVFNGSSLYFDGTAASLDVIPGTLGYGSGDFAVELFANFSSLGVRTLVAVRNDPVGWTFRHTGSALEFNANGGVNTAASWVPVVGKWYHLAVNRSGSTIKLFVDGVPLSLSGGGTDSSDLSGGITTVGYSTLLGNPFYGYMQELRISNVSRWATNFAPPARPYGS